MSGTAPLWVPTEARRQSEAISAFMSAASGRAGKRLDRYADLHRWSVEDRESFWSLAWDEFGILGSKGDRILVNGDAMAGAAFFPDASLNFAENLLRRSGREDAIVFCGEDKVERRLSWDELRNLVSACSSCFAHSECSPAIVSLR